MDACRQTSSTYIQLLKLMNHALAEMTAAHSETDHAIALALDQRRQSEEDTQAQQFFDESLARILQDDEIDHTDPGLQIASFSLWPNSSACRSCCHHTKPPRP